MSQDDVGRPAPAPWVDPRETPDTPDETAPVRSAPVPPPRAPATSAWSPAGVPPPSWGAPPPAAPPSWGAPPAALGPPSGPLPAPAPAGRGGTGRNVLIGVLVACLFLGAGVAAWVLLGDRGGDTPAAGGTAASTDAGGGSGSAGSDSGGGGGKDLGELGDPGAPTAGPAPPSPAPPAVTPEEQALADLSALRDESLARVVLDGRWVAQVASKNVGITDPLQTTPAGSHQFFAVDILRESRAALATVSDPSDVLLLQSTDFGRRSTADDGDPYWVTLVDGGFADDDAVDAWCAQAYPQLTAEELANTCVPRTLTPPHD